MPRACLPPSINSTSPRFPTVVFYGKHIKKKRFKKYPFINANLLEKYTFLLLVIVPSWTCVLAHDMFVGINAWEQTTIR